ncbi:MAG: glycosyltransferase family 1 protein [Candidatus Aenigmatarchaeota archaeon]|nr:glycosyltransferase family 4 protein [Nanoarchaeota archaeon]
MKILLTGLTIPSSGIMGIKGMDSYIYNLGLEYINLGHDVNLIVRGGFKPKDKWIKTAYSPSFSWLVYPYFLTPQLLGKKADVFHSDYVTSGYALVKSRRRPCVVSIHDVLHFSYEEKEILTRGNKLQNRFFHRWFGTIKKADGIIIMSNSAKEEAIEYTDIPEEKLHVVYNGVDRKKFFPTKRKPNKKLRIGYLGGLDGRKNAILLVETFKKLIKQRDDVELHIGGIGKNLERFRNMKIKNAKFYGWVSDDKLNEFYNSLDLYVFPSLKEGFGNMIVEAMSCGTPVLGSNRSSLPEVIGDAGMIAEPDVESMSNAINKFLDSKKLRERYVKKGFERANHFSWKNSAKSTLKVYESVR